MPQHNHHRHDGYANRERAGSSCSSGYGSDINHDQHRASPHRQINRNHQHRNTNGNHRPTYPEMTLLCHRVDLSDDFVPSKSDGNPSTLEPVRCLTFEGGCICDTPCSFCHTLIEDDVSDLPQKPSSLGGGEAPPAGIHPGFAFLFNDNLSAGAVKKEVTSKVEEEATITCTLVIDTIFAQNHDLLAENPDGTVKLKKYHHPPIGKFRYCPPLMELPAFFSDVSGGGVTINNDSARAEVKADTTQNDSNVAEDTGGGLDSFFDDFSLAPPPPKPEPKPVTHKNNDRHILVLRTPMKTVVKKTIISNHLGLSGKCLCEARYVGMKAGASQPNPYDPAVVHNKYWAQRRRLFKKFDDGIRLDGEGWYSVTPEVVADHVAYRFAEAAKHLMRAPSNPPGFGKAGSPTIKGKAPKAMVILDAFCGCGGNAIAFAKLPSSVVSHIICIDVDRTKLRKAAHNASIYSIPPNRIIFVEANSVAVMERCYKNGTLVMEPPPRTAKGLSAYPPRELYDDFTIGGIDLLTEYGQRIDAIFMDPPWGGIDYHNSGKDGYDLARDMKIRGCERGCVGFPPTKEIDGFRLLQIAAAATSTRFVVYDLPRNANKRSLAEAALEAGYEGNCKLEEHYLNGRLKTVTAYFGQEFRQLLDLKRNDLH